MRRGLNTEITITSLSYLFLLTFYSLVNTFRYRFKGFALVDRKPNIEVLYFIANGVPILKLGFDFKSQYLYKVVRMFYGEDKIKSTWIKFSRICKYKTTL